MILVETFRGRSVTEQPVEIVERKVPGYRCGNAPLMLVYLLGSFDTVERNDRFRHLANVCGPSEPWLAESRA